MPGYSVSYTVVDNATKQIDAINRRLAAMRAPVERLSRQVSRFVDLSGLRKVQQGFEWIGRAAGTVLRTLTAIVPVAGALFGAASIAGVAKLVQGFAAFSHELQQNADNIGMTTQQLQQFQDAARLAGGNANDMTEGLKGLHTAVANIAIGQGGTDAIQWFQRLGINIRDASGHMRKLEEIESEMIRLAISRYDGHMSEVARRLGIGRSTLYRKLKDFGLEQHIQESEGDEPRAASAG